MEEVIHLVTEMSPFLLLGFLMAGLLHAFVPKDFYKKHLSGKGLRSVVKAALLGVPLPLCSCGVIPTAMGLRKEGASKGATVSFLIATPQTGVDSIVATYSLMGLPFALVRPIVAFVTAIFGGVLTDKTDNGEKGVPTEEAEEKHCCCHEHHHHHEDKQEAEEEEEEEHCHCHDHETEAHSLTDKIKTALRYAFVDMIEDIGKWLLLGLIIAGFITVCIPDSFFAIFADNSFLSMLLVLAISIPMYVCATGSIPVAVALMMRGLTPGAGLVLLMAGPACNVASIIILGKKLGKRALISYVGSIVVGSIVAGLFIDHCLPREWFVGTLSSATTDCCHSPEWWQWTCTAVLLLLLMNALIFQRMRKGGHECHCHHHH